MSALSLWFLGQNMLQQQKSARSSQWRKKKLHFKISLHWLCSSLFSLQYPLFFWFFFYSHSDSWQFNNEEFTYKLLRKQDPADAPGPLARNGPDYFNTSSNLGRVERELCKH